MTLEQMKMFETLAVEKNYGRGRSHAKQVKKLSFKIYDELVRLNILKGVDEDEQILEAAALIHDIAVGKEPHNEIAFDELIGEIPKRLNNQPLPTNELSAILYSVLFHRGHNFSERKKLPISDPGRTKRLAAIIRIADGLDYGPPFDAPVKGINLKIVDGTIVYQVQPASKRVEDRVKQYIDHTNREKVDLFREAFGKQIAIETIEF